MDIPNTMSREELARTKQQADAVNAKLKRKDGSQKGDMGKDAFLKLLITELKHQDPTQPMQDREFISQMAQFSALEQMTNVSKSMESLNRSARSNEAYSLLGKRVEAFNPANGRAVEGEVSRIFYRENDIRLMVNGAELGLSDIHAVLPPEEKLAPVEDRRSAPVPAFRNIEPAPEASPRMALESNIGFAVKAYGHNEPRSDGR
ncbi:MAG TPA: flagellar hook capping FlgD N-terminal domain-containing protein [Spirochaetota bacterium]|nr:flagellar hook capping FlgD N-terminal domain-containing protein [Spirochaetota bacterium]OPZ37441.1 MAG: Basal-body rod modification protein FlgD [Spirochaetes bacterium ADurb.BinA120]HNU92037.1 flagellar hook capping FlgD N-terminal domain-containing protein [Spirochaetota bacterium]HPI15636.1 flagellar hook capping FlgD N-terminal domain-containing protein [Spirochaetota bacterium]HPV98170.1 flagellar hook capping FlgD N-terminal domain-containing protein [Spirochaetota bacterium]